MKYSHDHSKTLQGFLLLETKKIQIPPYEMTSSHVYYKKYMFNVPLERNLTKTFEQLRVQAKAMHG